MAWHLAQSSEEAVERNIGFLSFESDIPVEAVAVHSVTEQNAAYSWTWVGCRVGEILDQFGLEQ